MSIGKEMRFKFHRTLVGDAAGWAASGTGAQLFGSSLEVLRSVEEPLTWTEENWPHAQGVSRDEFGNSLRCLSFDDGDASDVFVEHAMRDDATKFQREFDDFARTLICEEPVRRTALVMRANTQDDDLDYLVWKLFSWPISLTKGVGVPGELKKGPPR